MVNKRNRVLEITEYLESLGIEVNIGKNKARGNKGFFKSDGKSFRIDVAKNLTEETILKVLIHEFAHFVHYQYDKTLNTLEFIIDKPLNDILIEEMISLTVDSIPKEAAAPYFDAKEKVKKEIKNIVQTLTINYPDFKTSKSIKSIEQKINKTNLKYILKYDRVKVIENFKSNIYSIQELNCQDKDVENYLKLKSLQRNLKRINSKITRLNKYYNAPTELFARSLETYITQKELFAKKAPNLLHYYDAAVQQQKVPLIANLCKILL